MVIASGIWRVGAEHKHCARHSHGVVGKVLSTQQRIHPRNFFAVGHEEDSRICVRGVVVDQGRVAVNQLDVCNLGVHAGRYGYRFHFDGRSPRFVFSPRQHGTETVPHFCLGRHHVAPLAGVDDCRLQCRGLQWVKVPGDESVQLIHDRVDHSQSVDPCVGLCHMAAGAIHLEVDPPRVAQHCAGARTECSECALWHVVDVQSVSPVDTFQHTFLDQHFATGLRPRVCTRVFLGVLEHNSYVLGQLDLVLGNRLKRAEQHGRTAIMPAGMALALAHARVGQAGLLGHRESIEVCPAQDLLAAGDRVDVNDDSAVKHLGLKAHTLDFAFDKISCPRGFPPRLGMFVHPVTGLNHVRLHALCDFNQVTHNVQITHKSPRFRCFFKGNLLYLRKTFPKFKFPNYN